MWLEFVWRDLRQLQHPGMTIKRDKCNADEAIE